MNKIIKAILLCIMLITTANVSAQRRISGTVSDDMDVLPMANVTERDKNNRIVSQALTDMNGNFTMNIKDPNNTLHISMMGYKPWSQKIGTRNVFKVKMEDATRQMKTLEVKGKKMQQSGGLTIPVRELSGAQQTFSMDEMEGMAFESVDQALQGQIAGLDIVATSGNLGSGTQMRLRGTSSITGNKQPLIVVNDHIFELPEDAQQYNIEDMDNEEQFSTLLNVNPEDIESITVLKDAATAAKWGDRGANGVIEIKLRRGHRGPTNVTFSYKFQGSWQPEGYRMLDGDGYTMMLKESYYNPHQVATSIPELDYNMEYPYIYNHYSHNTDWVDAVRQFGGTHKYYVTLSGGGEKATFRISAGYDHAKGSIIAQKMNRFTTTTALDYWVSDRIKFSSNINMTFTTNWKNYGNDVLGRAYKAMPNMSINEYGIDENGLPYLTGNYFSMLPMAATINGTSASRRANDGQETSWDLLDMYQNGNPVARAYQAWWKKYQYSLTPQFSIEYKLLGKNNDQTQLNYVGDVQLNINNTSDDEFCPAGLRSMDWRYGGDVSLGSVGKNDRNLVSNSEYKSLEFFTRHDLQFYPKFNNEDHSVRAMIRWEASMTNSSTQNTGLWNVPTSITDPTVVALLTAAAASNGESRRLAYYAQVHYSYKSKYNFTSSVRADGSTGYAKGQKYYLSPTFSARWNIIDENFMKWSRNWMSMFSIRASWGLTGLSNGSGNQYNKYSQSGNFYNGHTIIIPENLSLHSLRREKKQAINLGFNLGLFDDLVTAEFELYDNRSSDQVMTGVRIPSANGYSSLAAINDGRMRNKGWELNVGTGWFAKVGKFSMKMRGNVSQNFNEIQEMSPLVLDKFNTDDTWQPTNGNYITRIQIHNALGSIYGLRYKGVYSYDYEHNGYTTASIAAYGYSEVGGTGFDVDGNEVNTYAASLRRGDKGTCPIAYDADGNMITDKQGNPLPMYYCYNETRYQFQGGDAIYEDINHDGQIDRYDVVYLGNSNPKCYGGFGFTFRYDRFQLNTGFNFRIGHQIVNAARLDYEKMTNNNNQSFATTWRWRKNGNGSHGEDVIPRALNSGTGFASYNSLPSDRYLENGDYLRFQYIQLSYDIDPKILKKWGIRSLKFFTSLNNVWCWSKYTGADPEVSAGIYGVATDSSRTPPARSFTASVNLGF